MIKSNFIAIMLVALITIISITLPGQLFLRGLPIGWALALLSGFLAVGILGFVLGKRYL